MAAPAIYEGVVKGETLFDGMKFWVAQRIPMRSTHIDMITSNGGQVVQLERLADVMIADHARKDAPPGSYSWRFVAESVKMGRLENLNDHPAGPPVNAIRLVGSSKPSKGTRAVFTDEDDRVLAQWVKEAERKGLPSKGNLIYQQLQSENPRHTFQSWRDRWIKHGQFQERADLVLGDGDHDPSRLPIPSGNIRHHSDVTLQDGSSNLRSQQSTAGRRKQSPRRALVSAHVNKLSIPNVCGPHAVYEPPEPPPSPKKPLKNQPFTEVDRDILLGMHDDILNVDEEKLFDAWEALANAYPQHTAQDWYKFWMNKVKRLRPSQRKEAVDHNPPDLPPKMQTDLSSAVIEPTQTHQALEICYPSADPPGARQETVAEAVFETNLKTYFQNRGLQVDLEPIVSGMKIRLSDLWRIVNRPEFGGFNEVNNNRQWGDVAQQLGFNNFRSSGVPSELREIYDSWLVTFAQTMNRWLQEERMEHYLLRKEEHMQFGEAAQTSYSGQLRQRMLGDSESVVDSIENLEIPSSPPQRLWSLGKPGHHSVDVPGDHRKNLQNPLATPNKRRRVDKGKDRLIEIPSTPEDLLRFQGQVHGGRSPFADRDESLACEDEVNLHGDNEDGLPICISQREFPGNSSLKTTFKEIHAEPETQDFHFSYRPDRNNSKKTSLWLQETIPTPNYSMGTLKEFSLDDSSTQTDSQQNEAEVQAIVDRYISLGYPIEIVTQALLATTLHTGDAATVMESLMRGEGIPVNIEGVWTEEDDRAVGLPENDGQYQRLLVKHKEDRCVDRRNFLREDLNRIKRSLRRT